MSMWIRMLSKEANEKLETLKEHVESEIEEINSIKILDEDGGDRVARDPECQRLKTTQTKQKIR